MARNVRVAGESWEAVFRAQATVARDLSEGDAWGELLPAEYGVLYALTKEPHGIRITDLSNDVLFTQA